MSTAVLARRGALSTKVRKIDGRAVARWLLLATGAFLVLGSISDLISDASSKLPGDHASTFRALTGANWHQIAASAHSTTPYITRLEIGYAVHELLFALLFLAVVAIPLRRGERWAWSACWLIVIADLAYGVLFGAHDLTILLRAAGAAVVAGIALIVLRLDGLRQSPSTPTTLVRPQ
jgi:hypothetical protein